MLLRSGDHSVLVSPKGGSILQWQWRERMILGPTRMSWVEFELKKRGETHWCYPNFGTDHRESAVREAQHGFLRNTLLDTDEGGESVAIFERRPLANGDRAYGPRVTVSVNPLGISTRLHVSNMGSNQKIPVLPALHPYFLVPEKGLSLEVGSIGIEGRDIPANNHPAQKMVINRAGLPIYVYLHGIGRVEIGTSETCSHVVVWSDNPTAYICVEPIFGKPGTFGTEEGRWLGIDERQHWQVDFNFQPA